MVDISKKKSPKGKHMHHQQLFFLKKLLKKLLDTGSPKGEIFNVARCAGIMAAKKLVK